MPVLTVVVDDKTYIKLKYLSKKRKIKMKDLLIEMINEKISDIKLNIS
jgi:glycosylphosphatidylinositol transamidase (GPIT) subunit GPI8